jgi:REP element-mobilizing transposase RayT
MPSIVQAGVRSATAAVPMEVLVWCVVADHVHAVVTPQRGGSVVNWVGRFKGRVAADARRDGLRKLWHRSSHDHVLRDDEAIADVVNYVLANPVRRGLVDNWREWPHCGSLTWDLSDWVDS